MATPTRPMVSQTWSAPSPSNLVASNTPAALYRLSFEPSAVVAVWTSTPYIGAMNRYPLSVAISYDECATWAHHRILANPGCQVRAQVYGRRR